MAKKRQVYIDVIVDDKGTVKRMAVDANKLDKALGTTGKNAKSTERNIKGVAQASSNGTKNFSKMAQGISGGLVPAYATLAAQIFAVSAAFNFLKDAGSLKLLEEGQMAYSASVGTSMKSLTQDIQRATNSQLSFREAAQAGAIGTAAGLTPDQITKLGKAARETSTILGRDLTDSFNRLVRGVTKAEPELLDELGIILRLDEATQKYKDNLDIKGPLTAFQRSQAVTADVLGQVEEKYSKVLAVTGGGANEFAKLATSFDDIINKIKSFSVKFLTPIAKILQEFPELIALAFAPFTAQIVNAAMPGVGAFQDKLQDFSKTAQTSFEDASAANQEFSDNIKKQKEGLIDPSQLQEEVKSEADTLAKKGKLRSNSLISQVAQGKTLNEEEIKSLERSLSRQRGNYKNFNQQQLNDGRALASKLRQINQTSASFIERTWTKTNLAIKVGWNGLKLAAKATAAGITAAFVAAGRAITFALNAISWISLIATLGTLVYSFFKTKDAAEETADSFDYMGEKIDNLVKEGEKFTQLQNIINNNALLSNKYLEAYGKRLGDVSSEYLASAVNLKDLNALSLEHTKFINEQSFLTLQLSDELEEHNKMLARSGQQYVPFNDNVVLAAAATAHLSGNLSDLRTAADNADMTFEEFVMTQEGGNQKIKDGLKVLFEEKRAIEESTNSRFKNNAAVRNYLSLLSNLKDASAEELLAIFQQRDGIQELSADITNLTRLQKDNARTSSQLYNKLLPLNEYDTFLDKLSEELFLTEKTAAENEEKTEAEIKRIKVIKELSAFYQNLAEIETMASAATVALQTAEFNLLKGKTKLVQKDIKAKSAIGKNQIQIFKTEQSILRAQQLQSKDRKEALELIKNGSDLERARGQDMLKTVDARGRELMIQERNLELLRAQTTEMENQLNFSTQLAEVATQSLENNLKSGLAALIKGTESSFKDSLLKLAKGVLNSVADFLAEDMTKRIMKAITGAKDPDEKMAAAILASTTTGASTISTGIVAGATQGANIIAARIIAASGGSTAPKPPPGGGTPTSFTNPGVTPLAGGLTIGDPLAEMTNILNKTKNEERYGAMQQPGTLTEEKKGFWEMLFGTKKSGKAQIEGLGAENSDTGMNPTGNKGRSGGFFSQFINDFGAVFDKNAEGGFLEKMGNLFGSFGDGLSSLFQGLPDLLGGLFGGAGGGGGFLSSILGAFGFGGSARYGGIMKGYATGGIARGRNAGYPAVLHGTEAVVPLPSGGKIPVEMKSGARSDTNNVSINVNMSNDGSAQTDSQSDSKQAENMGSVLAMVVQEELQRQKRPGGILSPYGAA